VWVVQPRQLRLQVGDGPKVLPEDAVAADRLFESAKQENPRISKGGALAAARRLGNAATAR